MEDSDFRREEAPEEETVLRFILEGPGGEEMAYEVVGTFTGENGKDYMALQPADSDADEVVLIGFHAGPGDGVILDAITDDDEYEEAADTFLQLFGGADQEEYDLSPMYDEEWELARAVRDYFQDCYEDADGRLFVYGPDDGRIYLDEIEEEILDGAVGETEDL